MIGGLVGSPRVSRESRDLPVHRVKSARRVIQTLSFVDNAGAGTAVEVTSWGQVKADKR